MKQLTEIPLTRLSNGAHFSYMERVITRVKDDTKATTILGKFVSGLETAFAEEDRLLALSRKSQKTDAIAKADRERDRLYSSLRKAVKAFVDTGVDKFAGPATILLQSMKDYNINTAAQIDKESGLLTNLVNDFQTTHAAQVETLALTDLVVLLKTANEQVKSLTKDRIDDRVGFSTGALKSARLNTDAAYRTMVQAMNGYVVLNGEADLGAIIDVLNVEVQHYKREALGQKANTPATSAPEGTDKPDEGTKPTPEPEPDPKPGGNEGDDDEFV